jgi:hypothetical protein
MQDMHIRSGLVTKAELEGGGIEFEAHSQTKSDWLYDSFIPKRYSNCLQVKVIPADLTTRLICSEVFLMSSVNSCSELDCTVIPPASN